MPNERTTGIILSLYKNKGDKNSVDSYRGEKRSYRVDSYITLLSCMGKLFTYVINKCLKFFVESKNNISEEQIGLRNGCSTFDHIFTFDFITGYYTSKGKRLYLALLTIVKPLILSTELNCGKNSLRITYLETYLMS